MARLCCGGGLVTLDSAGVVVILDPKPGVPSRSTPSRAAVIIALPNVLGSKRAGRLEVLRDAALESEGRPVGKWAPPLGLVPVPTAKGDKRGDDCCNFSFLGLARCAWKSSTRWG